MSPETLQQWAPVVVSAVTTVVLPFVGWAVKRWLDAKASTETRALIARMADGAYLVAEQIARRTPGQLDDLAVKQLREVFPRLSKKTAVALLQVERELGRKLKPAEREAAVAEMRALHERARRPGSLNAADLPPPPYASPR